jgi:hypothetical protein
MANFQTIPGFLLDDRGSNDYAGLSGLGSKIPQLLSKPNSLDFDTL